jgi:uncharacterized protein (DUF1810 family)
MSAERAYGRCRNFAAVAPERAVFRRLLDAFFDGRPDERTLEMLREGA